MKLHWNFYCKVNKQIIWDTWFMYVCVLFCNTVQKWMCDGPNFIRFHFQHTQRRKKQKITKRCLFTSLWKL